MAPSTDGPIKGSKHKRANGSKHRSTGSEAGPNLDEELYVQLRVRGLVHQELRWGRDQDVFRT